MLIAQAEKIQATPYKPDIVIAIARGGLIPARILTDLLQNQPLAVINIQFYSGTARTINEPILKQPFNLGIIRQKILLVDDIADTGKTITFAKSLLESQSASEVRCSTLYIKPCSIHKPDFFEEQTSKWVIFPWDVKETIRSIVQTNQAEEQLSQEIAKLEKNGLPKELVARLLSSIQKEFCDATPN